ncbi:MAG: cob(I)yrinic acid a,c-diamide adenosyltransferase [Gemmatimonadota bacterium]
MKIYTRGGDGGETGLFGGDRVPKNDPRVEAYGSVDELNAALGLALAMDSEGVLDTALLAAVQEDLFAVGARLATADPERALRRGAIPRLDPDRVGELERWIDRLDTDLPALDAFILPGGSSVGAQLHVARTVCRRAERAIAGLTGRQPDLEDAILPYVNRLSDLLFTLARAANLRAGREERRWTPRREAASREEER